jgi:hypothetical protein
MNRHFIYNALPTDALGAPTRTPPAKPADGDWRPLRPGYEARTLADGSTEVRGTPGSLTEMATKPAPVKPREPAYQPADFPFQYHGPKGQSGEVIPKRPETAALAQPDEAPAGGSCGVQAPAEVPMGYDEFKDSVLEFVKGDDAARHRAKLLLKDMGALTLAEIALGRRSEYLQRLRSTS